MKKITDFKEVYKLPLKYIEDYPFMVLPTDGQRAFDFEWSIWETYEKDSHIDGKSIHDIIAKLNGNDSIILENYYNFTYKCAYNSIPKFAEHYSTLLKIYIYIKLIGLNCQELVAENANIFMTF